jgi:hypothetical protein
LGAMTYAAHPEGIVEYQKRKWLDRVSRLLAAMDARRGVSGTHPPLPGARTDTAGAMAGLAGGTPTVQAGHG